MALSEEGWEAARRRVEKRIREDESMKALLKKHENLVKRIQQVEKHIGVRQEQIEREELNKEIEATLKAAHGRA